MHLSSSLSRFCSECRSSLRRLRRDDGGATAIMTALALTMLVGFVGLGTEVGMWYAERRAMQTASDAAAMGAAFEIYKNGEEAEGIDEAGQADSTRNGFTNGSDNVTVVVNHPPTQGKYVDEDTAVETILTKKRPTLLGSLFMGNEVDIKVRSVATVEVTDVFCLIALAPNEEAALFFAGNAEVLLNGCGIHVNSDDPDGAMTAQGASVVGASYADIVGGLTQGNNSDLQIDNITTGADAVADPYAHLDVPDASCTYNNVKVNTGQNVTLNPGKYCGGLDIQGTAHMTAGNYIIAGDFDIGAQGILTTDTIAGVTIFLTEDGGEYGQFNMNAQAHVSVTASTLGDYMGIAFFQDRNAPIANTGSPNSFTGGSNLNIVGALYFPKQLIKFNGGNSVNGTCTRIVAFMISFEGDSGLNTDCGYGFGTPQIYPPVLAE
jgi:Flp pilus assembly pilin Flp